MVNSIEDIEMTTVLDIPTREQVLYKAGNDFYVIAIDEKIIHVYKIREDDEGIADQVSYDEIPAEIRRKYMQRTVISMRRNEIMNLGFLAFGLIIGFYFGVNYGDTWLNYALNTVFGGPWK